MSAPDIRAVAADLAADDCYRAALRSGSDDAELWYRVTDAMAAVARRDHTTTTPEEHT